MSVEAIPAHATTTVRSALRAAEDAGEALTRISRLASALLNASASLVSLIDDDRQRFAGHHGLPVEWAAAGSSPVSHSLCRHVVELGAPLRVDDLQRSSLPAAALARRDLGVGSYAGAPICLGNGVPVGAMCALDAKPRAWTDGDLQVLADLAALAASELELQMLRTARFGIDDLTGLPNRSSFEQLARQAIAATRPVAVVALGVDEFRSVNETLGHAVGDALLIAVADRLAGAVRAGDSVCRLAGDEFLVLCEAVHNEADANVSAERLRRRLSDHVYDLEGRRLEASVTAGVAVTFSGADPECLIDTACAAMRDTKASGRFRIGWRQPAQRLTVRRALAGADERNELHLVYQPVVDIRSGAVRALEALLRWTHPVLGTVSPAEFIPAAEATGAIVQLGEWVLGRACDDVAAWRQLPGSASLVVGINVAPIQLSLPTFPDVVAATADAAGIPASALGIEITERTLLASDDTTRSSLQRLKSLGMTLAIDDFGTGYSALSYLAAVPADVLKIDGSFIASMYHDDRSRQLVRGIQSLASGLGLATVAEGVETQAQHDTLLRDGFAWAQGYLYARPVVAADVHALLSRSV